MTLHAEISGRRATGIGLSLPPSGPWHATVDLDSPGDLSSTPMGCSLSLAGLTLVGTLVRPPSPFQGALRVSLVGGGGGWRKTVPARGYQSDAGLRLSLILGDAAREVSESVRVDADPVVGEAYVRERGAASRVLHHFTEAWYIDAAGTTRLGARADATLIGSPFTVLETDGAQARYLVETETLADWMPGRRFMTSLGARTIAGVMHTMAAGSLRTEVYTP